MLPAFVFTQQLDTPPDDLDNGVKVKASLTMGNSIEFRFWGANTPGNKRTLVRLWLLTNHDSASGGAEIPSCEISGEWALDCTLSFGSKEVTSNVLPGAGSGSAWAKEIAVTKDRTLLPGARQTGQSDLDEESVPTLVFDCKGSAGFIIQMIREDPMDTHTFGFHYRTY